MFASKMRTGAVAFVIGAALVAPATAGASAGTMIVTQDTVLTEDHIGNILVDANDVTLDCAGHSVSGPGVAGFSGGITIASHTGVTVRRCVVTGFDVNGIYGSAGASFVRYEANVLLGNGNHGIHLDAGTGNVVVGNTSRANGAIGIVLTDVTQSRIQRNTVQDNMNWAGIALLENSNDNTVVANTASGNAIGFLFEKADGNAIGKNLATTNTSGFDVTGSDGNTFWMNRSEENENAGYVLSDTNGTILSENVAARNVLVGIELHQATNATLRRNSATGNGRDGFLLDGSSNNLDQNRAAGNAGTGFFVNPATRTIFTENVSERNGAAGFDQSGSYASDVVQNFFSGNVARENATDGFVIFGGSGDQLRGNVSVGNGGYGLALGGDAVGNTVAANLVAGNGWEGIALVYGASRNDVVGNVARRNEAEGISVYFGSNHNNVRHNLTTGNANSGVLVFQSSNNSITDNRSFRNNRSLLDEAAGISLVEGSTSNDVLRNVACRNGVVDAYDDHTGTANVWQTNEFCTSDI